MVVGGICAVLLGDLFGDLLGEEVVVVVAGVVLALSPPCPAVLSPHTNTCYRRA